MKIKIYIVTYNNHKDLDQNLNSLFNSNFENNEIQINIINNHSTFYIREEFSKKCNILNNSLRPDFSTGHLSRNWNQAIINGFKDLNNPDCDIVITSQDDVIWKNDWISKTIPLLKSFNFLQFGIGDCICIYSPESIKKIGLWDERFCNIGYQESDFFFRQLVFNKEKCSINNWVKGHERIHNPCYNLKDNFLILDIPTKNELRQISHIKSTKYHDIGKRLFISKWNIQDSRKKDITASTYWNEIHYNYYSNCLIPSYILYPYFEKDYYKETYIQQNYNWNPFITI